MCKRRNPGAKKSGFIYPPWKLIRRDYSLKSGLFRVFHKDIEIEVDCMDLRWSGAAVGSVPFFFVVQPTVSGAIPVTNPTSWASARPGPWIIAKMGN